jgi:hypothetical protein
VSRLVRVALGLLLAFVLMPHVAGAMVPADGDGDGYLPPADCSDSNATGSTRTATAGPRGRVPRWASS